MRREHHNERQRHDGKWQEVIPQQIAGEETPRLWQETTPQQIAEGMTEKTWDHQLVEDMRKTQETSVALRTNEAELSDELIATVVALVKAGAEVFESTRFPFHSPSGDGSVLHGFALGKGANVRVWVSLQLYAAVKAKA